MFSRLLAWIREALKMLTPNNVKQAFRVDVALTSEMLQALDRWAQMYQGRATWLNDQVKSLGLEASVAGEIARAVTIEMAVRVEGSGRATALNEVMQGVVAQIREQVEKGCALGGLMLKPYVDGDRIVIDYVRADQFYPVRYDNNGAITSAIFADQRHTGRYYYTRLEYHEMTETGCVIRNLAFKSSNKAMLGQPVPLTEVDEWANLQPEATVTGIDRPLFAYFRFPLANHIDATSPLGVSCFSRAEALIEQADVQWSRVLWEFESGERALYADVLAFKPSIDGTAPTELPTKRLYRTLDMGGSEDALFEAWSPTLREENLLRGLNAILRRIEYACGLAYGTLSEPQIEAKTATEIRTSMQRSYVTITDTQKALQGALDGLLYAMDVWATLYNLAPRGTWQAEYTWGDAVVADKELQMAQDRQSVTMGVMPKYRFLMRHYNLTETEAKVWIEEAASERPDDAFGFEGAPA